MSDIDNLVKAIDPAPHAPEQGPGARELRAMIVDTPVPRGRRAFRLPGGRLPGSRRVRRPVRRPVLAGLVAAAAVAVAIGVGLPAAGPATQYANAAVSINRSDGYFSVTVTDPTADRRRFEEAFAAVGLNVMVKVIPVPPDEVGELVGPIVPEGFKWHGSIGTQAVEPCASAFCGKVWMPADFPGRVVLGIGRPARPGEPYADDWIVNETRDHSSDTVDLYVVPGPGPGAGPAPDPRTVAEPQWYDLPG
ncbi:hypothetical protein [Nonomuraea sp. NPDC050783]|uniref:hypothetical protein n=1 Tax=Nonomuraea sp. NPDC050783 TaxID=3154634 RepID=UPI0034672CEF